MPLSGYLGRATEEIAAYTGPTLGGLLNATLGNLAELIIAILALRAGLVDLVKASITGSILGNLLLVLGAAQLVGGLRHKTQRFSVALAGLSISLLVIAVIGLVIPAIYHCDPRRSDARAHAACVDRRGGPADDRIRPVARSTRWARIARCSAKSREVANESHAEEHDGRWSLGRAVAVLLLSAGAVGWLSEILVGSTQEAIRHIGLSEVFVGLIVVPIIGNAAEHSSAVLMAMRNRMDLAVSIAVGSSAQVALLIAPVLVFVGLAIGRPIDLAFSTFEVMSVVLAVAVATSVVRDAESDWLEGAFLLLVYGMLGVAFFYY